MHMVDPTRDPALMNRSDNVLTKQHSIPGCWYQPVVNKGMVYDDKSKSWKDSDD